MKNVFLLLLAYARGGPNARELYSQLFATLSTTLDVEMESVSNWIVKVTVSSDLPREEISDIIVRSASGWSIIEESSYESPTI